MTISQSRQKGRELSIADTKAFIDDDPTTVVVQTSAPGDKVRKPGGGFDRLPGPMRDPQTVKLIHQTSSGLVRNESTYSEVIRKYDYVMVTLPDAEFELGDSWEDGNNVYRIEEKLVDNGYEKKYGVKSFGPEPNYG